MDGFRPAAQASSTIQIIGANGQGTVPFIFQHGMGGDAKQPWATSG
jgi:hypothetical protein